MTLTFEKPELHRDWVTAAHSFANLLIEGSSVVGPVSAVKSAVSVYPTAATFVASIKGADSKTPENLAWTWLSMTLAETVTQFLTALRKETILEAGKIDAAVLVFLTEALDLPDGCVFDQHAIESPATHSAIARARGQVTQLINDVTLWTTFDQAEWLRVFDDCIAPASVKVFAANHQDMKMLSDAMTGPMSTALRKDIAWARHADWITKRFRVDPVFSPDGSVKTPLSALYIRLRTYWHEEYQTICEETREPENRYKAHLADLHETVESWLDTEDQGFLKIVAGGPGSGKSSFAKAITTEVSQKGRHRIVFIELQQMALTPNLYTDIETYLRQRDRPVGGNGSPGLPENPLDWMKTDARPVLFIFDGLDEITQDTEAAKEIARHFVLNLDRLVREQNQAGTKMHALLLGRNLACQAGIAAAKLPREIMLNVAPIRTLEKDDLRLPDSTSLREDRIDYPEMPADLIRDQRPTYWEMWCHSQNLKDSTPPEAVTHEDLKDLNVEPLLLHLLILSDYCEDRWHEAVDNRNVVYRDILDQIHRRNVREDKPGKALTENDFLLLMECLGLAAWHGNLRTGTKTKYEMIRDVHARAIKKSGVFVHADLDSMVLQTHARKVDGAEPGFEFIHKSFGEYLTARGLISLAQRSKRKLQNADVPASEHDVAAEWVTLVDDAELTPELIRFLGDEARLQTGDQEGAGFKTALEDLLTWVNTNGMPAVADTFRRSETKQRCAETALLAVATSVASHLNSGFLNISWGEDLPIYLFHRLRATTQGNAKLILSMLNLRNAWLSGAYLSGAVLNGADLGRATLIEADLRNVKLLGAELREANLRGAYLDRADLSGAILSGADLRGAILRGADLRGAELREADLSGAILSGADLSGAILSGADLSGADLSEAILRGADLRGAILRGADLSGADLREAILSGAILRGAILSGANLSGADLRGAILSGANLSGANLSGADLSGANLSEANLRGANLSEANLQSTDLTDCIFAITSVKSVDFSMVKCDLSNIVNSIFGVRKGFGLTKLPEGIDYPEFWHVADDADENSPLLQQAFDEAYAVYGAA